MKNKLTWVFFVAVNVTFCLIVVVGGMEEVLPSPNCGHNASPNLGPGKTGRCVCEKGWKLVEKRFCRKMCSPSDPDCPAGTACPKDKGNQHACVCAEGFTLSSLGKCVAKTNSVKPSSLTWVPGAVVGAIVIVVLVVTSLVLIIRYRRKHEDNANPAANTQGGDEKGDAKHVFFGNNAVESAQSQAKADSAHELTDDPIASNGETNTPGERISDLYSNGKIVKNKKNVST